MTSGAFARACGIPLRTLQDWLAQGRLPRVERSGGGRYLIPAHYVERVRAGLLPLR
jgi:DNA-binding transcriptional MerR regulator